jgi:hypothetical protein
VASLPAPPGGGARVKKASAQWVTPVGEWNWGRVGAEARRGVCGRAAAVVRGGAAAGRLRRLLEPIAAAILPGHPSRRKRPGGAVRVCHGIWGTRLGDGGERAARRRAAAAAFSAFSHPTSL